MVTSPADTLVSIYTTESAACSTSANTPSDPSGFALPRNWTDAFNAPGCHDTRRMGYLGVRVHRYFLQLKV